MTEKTLPTPEYLRKRLRYEPETGKLFWLDCDEMPAKWLARLSGKEAFIYSRRGYFEGCFGGKKFSAHRVAWAIHYGEWPSSQIDHINGVRSDNRIENLRAVTAAENGQNRRISNNNTSGVNGVYWSKRAKKWKAHITAHQKKIHLGYFQSIDDAKVARDAASAHYGFSSRHGAAV